MCNLSVIKDIRNLIKEQKNNPIYTPENLLESIEIHVDSHLLTLSNNNSTWKLNSKSQEFKEDLVKMGTHEMAMKYGVTYQGIYYHKKMLAKKSIN